MKRPRELVLGDLPIEVLSEVIVLAASTPDDASQSYAGVNINHVLVQ